MTIEPVAHVTLQSVKHLPRIVWAGAKLGFLREGSTEPLYTAEALAAAWEQGRTASAEVADRKEKGWRKRPTQMSTDTAAHFVANAIRALPNPHKEGE